MTDTLDRPFDFVDPDMMQRGLPLAEFAQLRRTAPVWWNAQEPGAGGFTDGGFWVISRHEHIKAVSRDNDNWSTNENGVVVSFFDGMDPSVIDSTKALLINHDPPEHTRLRKIVSKLFTPRGVHELEEKLRGAAYAIVTDAREKGAGDFIADVAAKLPVLAIADLIGVPQDDREAFFGWANSCINFTDPDAQTEDPATASANLLGYAYAMAEDRRKNPKDDIVTMLVQADADGEWMSEAEFGFFVMLLAVAGNETTRNAVTHGINAFLDNPGQWELYQRERPKTSRRRGHSLGDPGQLLPAHRPQRRRDGWRHHPPGSAGRIVLRFGQLRRGCLRPARHVRHRSESEPALEFRRQRHPLLHRRESGTDGDLADARRDRRRDPQYREGVGADPSALAVAQRPQDL